MAGGNVFGLLAPVSRHVHINADLNAADEYLDLKPLYSSDQRYMFRRVGILIEGDAGATARVRGVLEDDSEGNVSTWVLDCNILQGLRFKIIYKAETDRGNPIKILGN